MGVTHIEAFNNSLIVVQQVDDIYQRFDASLNSYLEKYLEIIPLFDDFTVQHVSGDENIVVNDLAQQALGFRSNQEKFYVLEKLDVPVCQTGCFGFQPMHSAEICSNEVVFSKTEWSDFRNWRVQNLLELRQFE
jgi:hypothetical protein